MYSINFWHLLGLYCRQISVLFLLLSLCNSYDVVAQIHNMAKNDKKKIHFGFLLGMNNARFRITHADQFTYHDSLKVVQSPASPGFNVGIISDLHIGENTDIRFIPTLIFAEKDLVYSQIAAAADKEVKQTVESILLNFPLTFKYKSDRFFNENFRFYGLVGMRFDWDLASNSKARRATDIVKIAPFDFSIEYGVGTEFYFPSFILSPEIRITRGLPNLFVPTENYQYSDVLRYLKSSYLTFSLQFEG